MDAARRVLISGRVQGVGFRWSTVQEARRVGALGWVRNLDDGRVEALVQGETAAVDALLAFLRVGPRGARVDSVVVQDASPDPAVSDFRQA